MRTSLHLGVALTSCSALLLQVLLTRLFSVTMFYHFAFMAISLAMLGMSCGGVLVYRWREQLGGREQALLAWSCLGLAATTVLAVAVILHGSVAYAPEAFSLLALARVYLVAALPFCFAGFALALAMRTHSEHCGLLYRSDLLGAGVGCALAIPLLDACGGVGGVLIVAVLACAAGLAFAWPLGGWRRAAAGLAVATGVGLAIGNAQQGWIGVRHDRAGEADGGFVYEGWNSYSRVTVTGDPERDPFLLLAIDADAASPIYRGASDPRAHPQLDAELPALAFRMRGRDGRVLIIGPGGGLDVMIARRNGARRIVAVELNSRVVDAMAQPAVARFTGGELYRGPDIEIVVDDGRHAIRQRPERWDLIQATLIDTWAATAAGAFSLSEHHLYTVEAFVDFLGALEPDGVLQVTRWYFEPPDQALRLASLARAGLEASGIQDPAAHVVMVKERDRPDEEKVLVTLMVCRRPWTADELQALRAHARANNQVVLYPPADHGAEASAGAERIAALLEHPSPERIWDASRADIAPPTDDRPFFFNTTRISDLGSALGETWESRKVNVGLLTLVAVLGMSALAVLALLVLPLRSATAAAGDSGDRWAALLICACLGAGYIACELVLVQELVLLLGHPTYALSVALLGLLVSGAAGSALSQRLPVEALGRALLLAAALAVGYAYLLPLACEAVAGMTRPVRIALAALLAAPLGFCLGVPLPLLLRRLGAQQRDLVAWAWATNGSASVLGSAGTLLLAVAAGFQAALLTAAAIYATAALASRWLPR